VNSEDEAAPPSPAEPSPAPQEETAAKPLEWPRCGYCGSPVLRESRRGGLQETALRLAGCTLYRCESCGRRFAFATLGHPERHRSARVPLLPRASHGLEDAKLATSGRRRAIGVLATLIASLLTFLTAAWLISRSERRRMEGDAPQQ
jgi:hypothetical protein